MPPSPVPSPKLDIPSSQSSVNISIIDTTTSLSGLNAHNFFSPEIPNFKRFGGPSYAFLIEHPSSGTRLLFDLGVRKDWRNGPPALKNMLEKGSMNLEVAKNTSEILSEHGIELTSIKDIIWSHRHFDHQGDPSTFPSSTSLTVGPGFKNMVLPGWPEDSKSLVDSHAWKGRDLVELDFGTDSRKVMVGRYRAIDYFGDGSFYLLQTPGHTVDHMCGFARTKIGKSTAEDEFILMGGDIAHHGSEYKPSKFCPIPDQVRPDPRKRPWSGGFCPGEIFAAQNIAHEGDDKWREPFFKPQPSFPDNLHDAEWSLSGLEEFDASDQILPICAHDGTWLGIIDVFPKPANDWKAKGWKQEGHFRFLADFNPEDAKL